jgi:phage terminase small subunit
MAKTSDMQEAKVKGKAWSALNEQHKLFVFHYLKSFNATKAALAAGYSANSVRAQASDLLTRPNIAAAVTEQMDRLGITQERISNAIAEIAFGADIADLEEVFQGGKLSELRRSGVPTHMIRKMRAIRRKVKDGDDWADVDDVTVESYSRLEALEKLAKIKAMFVDRTEHSGPGGEPLQFNIIRPSKAVDGQ